MYHRTVYSETTLFWTPSWINILLITLDYSGIGYFQTLGYPDPRLSRPSIIQTLDYLVSIISLVLKIKKLTAMCSCACAVLVTYVNETVCVRFFVSYRFIKSQGQMAIDSAKCKTVVNCNLSYPDYCTHMDT